MSDTVLAVEPMQVELFARALALPPREGEGVSGDVPLTFTESSMHVLPNFTWRPRPGTEWRVGTGDAAPATLHAEQVFEYMRPVRVGETLTVSRRPGRSWTKSGRRGELRFTETVTEFTDTEGHLVVTATAVGVQVSDGSDD